MADFELFLKERLNPLYRAHYALWVHWWPLWRQYYSGRRIQHKWQQFDMMREGQTVLDFGCGTGCFSIPAARLVGTEGYVYALDCFPQQLEIVADRAREEGLANIRTILSDCPTGLPEASVDTIWMCDVLHEIEEKRRVLQEFRRVLRRNGALVIYDGMRDRILEYTEGMFSLAKSDGKLMQFAKR